MRELPDVVQDAEAISIFTAGFAAMSALLLMLLLAGFAVRRAWRRRGIYEKYRLSDDERDLFRRNRLNRGD